MRQASPWRRYALGAGVTALAMLFSLGMQSMTGGRVVIMPFFPAMIAVALYAGVGPAVLCALVTIIVAWFSWTGGSGPAAGSAADAWTIAMFVIAAGLIISIAGRLRNVERRRAVLLNLERQARQEAERVGRMKDEFLATLSHELRNPLSAIVGWAQVLHTQPLPPQVVRGLEVIERNARSQSRIIDDLLDMSRIISGTTQLSLRPAELRRIVDAAIQTLQPAAQAKRITIETSAAAGPAGAINCDPDRLQQVIWNLLTNSVKFTPEGGRIEVDIEQSGQHVQIRVRDTGMGIDPAFLPFVFERFRQADPSITRRHSGLGLGLSICKLLVEAHGGIIHAASEGMGKGATFTIRLPLRTVESPPGDVPPHLHEAS